MTRKEDFFNAYEAYGKECKFMAIHISMPSLKIPEAIVNYKSNFEEKLKYYDEAYDDNLVMIRNENIKIVSFGFSDSIIMEEYDEEEDNEDFESIYSTEYNGMLSPNETTFVLEEMANMSKRKEEEVLSYEQMCLVLGLETED